MKYPKTCWHSLKVKLIIKPKRNYLSRRLSDRTNHRSNIANQFFLQQECQTDYEQAENSSSCDLYLQWAISGTFGINCWHVPGNYLGPWHTHFCKGNVWRRHSQIRSSLIYSVSIRHQCSLFLVTNSLSSPWNLHLPRYDFKRSLGFDGFLIYIYIYIYMCVCVCVIIKACWLNSFDCFLKYTAK